jgi:hypothetical protein
VSLEGDALNVTIYYLERKEYMNFVSKVADLFSVGVSNRKTETTEIDIAIDLTFIEEYAQEIHRVYVNKCPASVVVPSSVEFAVYLSLLVECRVCVITGTKLPIKPSAPVWNIPHGFSLVLEQVGNVYIQDERIQLNVRRLSHQSYGTLKTRFGACDSVRTFLGDWSDIIVVNKVLPDHVNGDEVFMLLNTAGEEIKHPRHDIDPAYPVLGCFLKMHAVRDVLNPRVSYGLKTEYNYAIRALASPRGE